MYKTLYVKILIFVCTLKLRECVDAPKEVFNNIERRWDYISMKVGRRVAINPFDKQHPNEYPKASWEKNLVFDFIVVGSGAGGATVAARISENRFWNVLLLEIGPIAADAMDLLPLTPYLQSTRYHWRYKAQSQANASLGFNKNAIGWPRGRALGGTTTINDGIYARGTREDYDRWCQLGHPGWCYKDVLPFYKKLEASTASTHNPELHGHCGPLTIEDAPFHSNMSALFVEAAQNISYKCVDLNGESNKGVTFAQSNSRHGRRMNVEKAYLRPIRYRPNLVILTESAVVKILINASKDVFGVKYKRNRVYHTALACKEVILSAGTFASPQLLMLSGLGPKAHLKHLNIPLIHELPVGRLMYDHVGFWGLIFTYNDTSRTLCSQIDYVCKDSDLLKFVERGCGPCTAAGVFEAMAYFQSPFNDVPDVELTFMRIPLDKVTKTALGMRDLVYDTIWKPVEELPTWSAVPTLLHPRSKGYLELRSKNPFRPPRLYPNYFTDPDNIDIKVCIAAIRELQRLNESPLFAQYNSTLVEAVVPGCEDYEYDTDCYWECALRHLAGTRHGQVGTNKMGSFSDRGAVVDERLVVHGVKGLRVVDASVMPVTLSGRLQAPTVMIGEQAADFIKSDWGIS